MTIPTSYDATTLADYLVLVLGEIATILGWDASTPQVAEAVTDTLLAYPVTDIADLTTPTQMQRVRALGAVMAWRAAVRSLSARYDVAEDTSRGDRSQAHKMALENLALAESYAGECGIGLVRVERQPILYVDDPYSWVPEDLQTVLP